MKQQQDDGWMVRWTDVIDIQLSTNKGKRMAQVEVCQRLWMRMMEMVDDGGWMKQERK